MVIDVQTSQFQIASFVSLSSVNYVEKPSPAVAWSLLSNALFRQLSGLFFKSIFSVEFTILTRLWSYCHAQDILRVYSTEEIICNNRHRVVPDIFRLMYRLYDRTAFLIPHESIRFQLRVI